MNNTLNTQTDTSPWLTRAEAAARLKVHPRTLDRWADGGRITRYAPNEVQQTHVRFKLSEVDALMKPQPSVAPDAGDAELERDDTCCEKMPAHAIECSTCGAEMEPVDQEGGQ